MRGTHIRGRRGTWATALAAAVIMVGVLTTIGVLYTGDDEAPAAPAAVGDTAARRPWQVTLDLEPSTGFVATASITDGDRQTLTVQDLTFTERADGAYGGEVTAFPSGTLDERQFSAGQQANDAWYLPAFTFAGHSPGDVRPWQTPAVGRPDPSGLWIVAYADPARATAGAPVDRQDLQRLIQAVRLMPPRDLRMPLRLGPALPDGLRLTYVRSPDHQIDRQPPVMGLGPVTRAPSGAAVYTRAPQSLGLTISAAPRDVGGDQRRRRTAGQTTSAGLTAWYEPGRRLTVEAERCVVTIDSARSRADLDSIVEQMTIGDCTDRDSWIPPLA